MTKPLLHLRAIFEFAVVAVCVVTFAFAVIGAFGSMFAKSAAGSKDYVEYWTSGQLLTHNGNPYDPDAILKLERSAGAPADAPALVMGNPPSALLLVLPLGLVGATSGEYLWELLLVAGLVASIQKIRLMHGRPNNLLHWLGYAFAPALACLLAGQVSIFILLGLVYFLAWHRSHPVLAGMSLWFCLLKPHLFLPFGVVLLIWIVFTRSYRILTGIAMALVASSAVITVLDPRVWRQYSQMMGMERLDRLPMPCIASLLRTYVPPHTLWLQCLPAAAACAWAVIYFWKRRERWDWIEDGSLLILISVLVAPYTWFTDQAVLIPAVLHGAYRARSRNLIAVLALTSATVECEMLRGFPLMHSAYYLWTTPAWLVCYLLATGPDRTAAVDGSADNLLATND
jgi:hypothetical protein